VVAFANGSGGRLILGIKDNPRVLLGIAETEIFRLEENKISPVFDLMV
jgi:predicted HTH transcriptional regulator